MSVLLFMPESGGNPLESVILTSDEGDFTHPKSEESAGDAPIASHFELKNGRPARKQSFDSTSVAISIESAQLNNGKEGDDVSSLGEDASRGSSSSLSSPRRNRPLTRTQSAATSGTGTSTKSAPLPLHRTIATAKQPQLRLTPMGAMFGANTPGGAKMVRAVNKAHERRTIGRSRSRDSTEDLSVDSMRVHCGVYV